MKKITAKALEQAAGGACAAPLFHAILCALGRNARDFNKGE